VRRQPAGDFDYERGGQVYSSNRRADPKIAAQIRRALGDAQTLINVGAGAGSYEPTDLNVTAVEPSAAMRAERPAQLATAIDAVAEDLPFPDDSFDAALASVTVHQWRDLARGLRELRRVTRGPVVVMTFDPVALRDFWLSAYAPEMMQHECARMPLIDTVEEHVGGQCRIESVPLAADCADGFAEAFFGRPESLLDEHVRRSQSAWGFVDPAIERRSVASLCASLDSGDWDRQHGELRTLDEYWGSLRLVISRR
jgi:SAM-dependent methyltransferase